MIEVGGGFILKIRDLTAEDRAAALALIKEFYASPGVLHPVPIAQYEAMYEEMCDGGSTCVRGLGLWAGDVLAGYCALSFGFSTEAGGPVVLLEELYIREEHRGGGGGTAVLRWLEQEYGKKVARIRLEVMPGNPGGVAVYPILQAARGLVCGGPCRRAGAGRL